MTTYKALPNISIFTKDWGIKFKQTTKNPTLDESKFQTNIVLPPNLPEFTVDINQPKLIAFVDASYANDPHKRRSTTGFVFTYYGGAIVYQFKTQILQLLVLQRLNSLQSFCMPILHSIYVLYLKCSDLVVLNLLKYVKTMLALL